MNRSAATKGPNRSTRGGRSEPLIPTASAPSAPGGGNPLNAIVDRPRAQAARAVAAAWLAFMAGLLVGGEVRDLVSFASSGAVGAVLVFLGFVAVSRCRRLPRNARRDRLVVLSLGIGVALGVANLAANWMIAESNTVLRALLVERMTTLEPRVALIMSPTTEEVVVRLFLMSGIAWVVSRLTRRGGLTFAIALVSSAFVFALLHLGRPFPGDATLSSHYRLALLAKYTLAGLPLGWVFWRWGLPYAMVCHVAANAAHLLLQKSVF